MLGQMTATVPDSPRPPGPVDPAGRVLANPGVVGIGLGSLLSDTGHEMATAALPGFLRSLGAPAAALGAIEGIADAALSAAKVAGGVVADRPGVQRRAVTAGGYALTAAGHGAFGLATVWPAVAAARAVSWIARGGKAPARDSLLAGSVVSAQLGRAFGVERAMDSLGAIAGPLLAAPLIVAVGYRWLFAISIIPGLLAAAAVLLLVREVPRIARASTGRGCGDDAGLGGRGGPVSPVAGGNRPVRVGELLGHPAHPAGGPTAACPRPFRHPRRPRSAVLLYAGHNAANAVAAYPAGAVADRVRATARCSSPGSPCSPPPASPWRSARPT